MAAARVLPGTTAPPRADPETYDDDDDDDVDELDELEGGSEASSSLAGAGGTASSLHNDGSVVSTVPDKYGFLGGKEYNSSDERRLRPEVVLSREKKWLHMLGQWEHFMGERYRKVRARCRKGIPASVRPRAWQYLCGGRLLLEQHRHLYTRLVEQEGDPRWIDDIRKDLHRQFPFHEMFASEEGVGQKELFSVLKAYSVLNKKVGYCQAQAPVAAFLLMHMPAEQAFWCLVSVCDKYLFGYYSQGMETLQIDGDILFGLLKKAAPNVYKHLARVKVIFKVALVLLKCGLGRGDVLRRCPTMYETLEALRNLPAHIMEEDFLVAQVLKLSITEDDFEYEHQRQVSKRRAAQKQALKDAEGRGTTGRGRRGGGSDR
ncbi:hypothetical protein B566_EDAN006708 [Ephemera danica]|nr:hypothetical protein B566_EDAN006708 [Ephemera danica]